MLSQRGEVVAVLLRKFQIAAGEPIPENERGPVGPSAELVDFIPPPLHAKDIVGRVVRDVTPNAGTYGMGGLGLFGLELGGEWLIVSIWGAIDWLQVNGWAARDMERTALTGLLVGRTVTSMRIDRRSMGIGFDDGTVLGIEEDSATRAPFTAIGGRGALRPDEDLRDGVFLSPTAGLWTRE